MTARNLGAPLSAILFSLVLGATITEPAVAAPAINYAMAFYGPWSSATSYKPGYVVTYLGGSYLCLVANSGVAPPTNTFDWAALNVPGFYSASSTAEGSGALSVALGAASTPNFTTGDFNTAFGDIALRSNTDGSYNSAYGYAALANNTAGNVGGGRYNTAAGYQALDNNTSGGTNTASGAQALYGNTTGGNNTASGALAL